MWLPVNFTHAYSTFSLGVIASGSGAHGGFLLKLYNGPNEVAAHLCFFSHLNMARYM